MGVVHLVSGGAMVLLSNDFSLHVSTFALNGPPGTPLSAGVTNSVFDLPLAAGTSSFLFLSAFFHFLIASPWGFSRYVGELARGRNRFRWVEYSLSSTLMILLIMLVFGITDLAALIGLGIANIAMILFGWLMEMSNNGLMHTRGEPPTRGGGPGGHRSGSAASPASDRGWRWRATWSSMSASRTARARPASSTAS
jgi:hypothetical protein